MKKTVILILIILPIFLLITISFAGRIFSTYQHVSVDKVEFVDENETILGENDIIKVNLNETKQTYIKIFPELASVKKVTYSSGDTKIFTVNKQGEITGLKLGSATLLVKTEDNSKTDVITVQVIAEKVIGVTISHTALTITEGESAKLNATVEVVGVGGALNKNVTFTSSDTSVAIVDDNGNVTAKKEGETTITVTTEDGGFTATCLVTVVTGTPPISFNFSLCADVVLSNTIYQCSVMQINLADYLIVDPELVDITLVKYQTISGNANNANATISNGLFTFINPNKIITVRAYVGDDVDNPTYFADIKLIFKTVV